jgi:hypothetical protein
MSAINDYLTKNKGIQYFFLFLSQDTFENDLPMEEILRERTFEYFSNNKVIDFWMISPFQFLQFQKNIHSNKTEILNEMEISSKIEFDSKKFYCFITSNYAFFNFLRLRVGDFQPLHFSNEKQVFSIETQIPSIKRDGFSFSCFSNSSIFKELILYKDKSFLFQKNVRKIQTIYNFLSPFI